MTKPLFFADQLEFRKWLEKNHDKKNELQVGYYKVNSGKPSMTWSESVDQALCFGWIDGIRRSIDDVSYQIRFTPRKASSTWSEINIQKVKELTKKGLMHSAGLESFRKRKKESSWIYSHQKDPDEFSPDLLKEFRSHKKAWKFFESLAPSYRKTSRHWIMSAKQESTRKKRLSQLIAHCEAGINPWKDNPYKKKKT